MGTKVERGRKKIHWLLSVEKLIIHEDVAVFTPEVKRIERTTASKFTDSGLQRKSPYYVE